jgi:predicted nuclease of predicted toxin-antitoxin system
MIYLIDNQLPVGLLGHLQAHGLEAIHVSRCGLERASDQTIWDYAKAHNCVVVSKDEDFFHLSGTDARPGHAAHPKLLLRLDFLDRYNTTLLGRVISVVLKYL